jgi:hypothetical protein
MPSFEIQYDADEDVLDVTFEVYDESFSRTITLNEQIVIYTDLMFQNGWGITLYGFQELCEESEILLEGLSSIPQAETEKVRRLLENTPLGLFLCVTDWKQLRVKVQPPPLSALLA